MAVVFLALNGDGLGHLVRVTTVCHSLAALGERPVIFSQGIFPLDNGSRFPGKRIPSLWKANYAVRRSVSAELRSVAEISLPSVLVEDTHPDPVFLPPNILRILLVRPAAFGYLSMLNEQFGRIYSRFLLCDFPHSPTWPYSRSETACILRWNQWHIVGPIYRSARQSDIAEVRRRHGISEKERVCVFSMGGGGRHTPGDTDAERFVAVAGQIAGQLMCGDRMARPIFIKGPYFPPEVEIGRQFEVVEREPLMPALLATAHGAFIRAGFNTPWECISAGTPFLPFIGTTVNEPVTERLQGMRTLGLLPEDFEQLWYDENWRAKFRQSCRTTIDSCPREPDARLLQELIVGPARTSPRAPVNSAIQETIKTESNITPVVVRDSRFTMPFVIRIDEVASSEPALDWLLQILSTRRLRASLGVVPYFLDFDTAYLDFFDPAGTLFEVCQQGYAQLPSARAVGAGDDAPLDSTSRSDLELRDLDWGRDRLLRAFPTRWSGGFSAPLDAIPRKLQSWWQARGGLFITHTIGTREQGNPMPLVYTSSEVWDRHRNWMHSHRWISGRLARQAMRRGYAGVALRPRDLREPRGRGQLIRLLDFLQNRGLETKSLSQIAAAEGLARPSGLRLEHRYWAFRTWTLSRL